MAAYRNKNLRRGTTLVELMVASVFLGIAASAILSVTSSNQRHAAQAEERMVALALAENEMANVRATARTSALPTGNVFYNKNEKPVLGGDLKITRSIIKVGGYTDLYQVDVSVAWYENTANAAQRKVRLVTYLRAPGG